jgi:acyl carrier protein
VEGGDTMNIFAKVKTIVAEKMGVDEEDITLETTFDDLNADSLDVVELIMALEEEFDMEIPDEDVEKIKTMGDAVEYIKEKQ